MRPTNGYPYRYELHSHTCRCSKCAHSTPVEMARAYYEKGYAGMVITDHFLRGNTAVDPSLSWEEKMNCYHNAYLEAAEYADGKDFHVLFGLEHQYGGGKEVLTYGIDLEFLLSHPCLDQLPLREYAQLVWDAGGFLSMAHPYRGAAYIDSTIGPQPDCLDGAELFNFFNTGEENKKAALLVEQHHLLPTSGGDVHDAESDAVGMAGVALPRPVTGGKELAELLRSGDYRLIINGELV